LRYIPGTESMDDGSWRKHGEHLVGLHGYARFVAKGRPPVEPVVTEKIGVILAEYKGAVGNAMRYKRMGDLLPCAVDSFAVDDLIHALDGGLHSEPVAGVAVYPASLESIGIVSAAFKTRTVTGSKGRSLVQEKELCPSIGAHDRPLPSLKLQHARNPSFVFKRFNDLFVFVDNATVTHPCTAGAGLDESS